ncbi:type II secretion system F family protein [Xanthomonas euvesicatoria]
MTLLSPALDDAWIRMRLSAKDRATFYRSLSLLLKNGVILQKALEKIYMVESGFGEHPNRPKCLMINDILMHVRDGRSFSEAIAHWAPPMEASLIAAGDASGDMDTAFRDVLDLHASRSLLMKTFFTKVPYPIVLFIAAGAMLVSLAANQVPPMLSIAPLEFWSGAGWALIVVSTFVQSWWPYLLGAAVAITVAVGVSLPRATGELRYRLDKFGPWKAYRQFTGAMFLKSYATMVKNQIKQKSALELLTDKATPYLRERLRATLVGINMGRNFGESLRYAEYDFPDPEAIAYIELLSDLEGFEVALTQYASEWMESAVERVSRFLNVFFVASLLAVGCVAAMTVLSSQQMTEVSRRMNQ